MSNDVNNAINQLNGYFSRADACCILIFPHTQTLVLADRQGQSLKQYVISTAEKGLGCLRDSFQTPTGVHRIRHKIGADAVSGSVFVGRENTGEIIADYLAPGDASDDKITSRIMWLEGLQDHVNKGGDVDTAHRYIYIHGTPDVQQLGKPVSHGCVRLSNSDVIDLFDRVEEGCLVFIAAAEVANSAG